MLTNARRPLLAALLTFALVLPLHAARAQKPAGGGAASQRTAQVQQVRMPGQKRYGMSGGASTAGATSVKSGSRLGNWLRRNFTVRGEVRQLEQTAKGMVRQGNLTAAAEELATNPVAPQGWRERRVVNSTLKKIFSASVGSLRGRSRAGDTEGARDAMGSLDVLHQDGRLGFFRSWRANRAEGKAFKNSLSAANKAGKSGDLDLARDNLVLATDMRGAENGKVQKGVSKFGKHSMKFAERAAKAGDPQSTMAALQSAADAASVSGKTFDQGRAEKLMNKAYKNAVPGLIKQAGRLYGQKAHEQAATALAEAIEIQESMGIKPGFFARRAQAKLVQKLGPRITTVREARAQQRAAEEAAQAAEAAAEATAAAPPTPAPVPAPAPTATNP